ncbi:MAG: TetR family transcriptional regulator, partial [Solirubrobacteraceae bacterium]
RECFLATFDLLAARELRRARSAYISSSGGLDARLRALVGAHLEGAQEEPKATHLVLVDALAVGEAGLTRVCRAAAAHEQLLAECFQRAARGSLPPAPLLRAMIGAVQGVVAARLGAEAGTAQPPREPLVEWALALQAPASSELAPWLAQRLRERMRGISRDAAAATRRGAPPPQAPGRRERGNRDLASAWELRNDALEAALRLAGRHGHRELNSPQIADAAGIPVEALLAHFATPDACMAAAHRMAAEQLCAVAAEARASEPDWPQAVRPLVAALLEHLAARPLHAQALVQSSWCLGGHTAAVGGELTARLAVLLAEDAPQRRQRARGALPLAGEAAVHALWHTIRCLLANRRMQLLPALTDHLSFLVLAPSLGAEPAFALLREGR